MPQEHWLTFNSLKSFGLHDMQLDGVVIQSRQYNEQPLFI